MSPRRQRRRVFFISKWVAHPEVVTGCIGVAIRFALGEQVGLVHDATSTGIDFVLYLFQGGAWHKPKLQVGCSLMMWFGRLGLVVLVMMISSYNSFNARAANKTVVWENAAFCRFETKFDPVKHDEEKLKNTINAIFNDDFDVRTSPDMGLMSIVAGVCFRMAPVTSSA